MKQLNLEQARSLVAAAIDRVRGADPEEFCKAGSPIYYEVRSPIADLAWGIETDPALFRTFVSTYEHTTECWIPIEQEQALATSAAEMLMRLKTNISGERWVDGALVRSFRAGTLLIALERIQTDIDELFPQG